MQPKPIDQLIFKGTHNSYQCNSGDGNLDWPFMEHRPSVQIDDFGVWAVELDYGVQKKNGVPTALVGHDSPGHGACWFGSPSPSSPYPYALKHFLTDIRSTKALKYRPVFIYYDIKDWGEGSLEEKFAVGLQDVQEVFQGHVCVLADYVQQHGRYPTLQEIVGQAVIYFPQQQFHPDSVPPFIGTLRGTSADHCTNPTAVENSIRTGDPADDTGGRCGDKDKGEGCRVLRLDQYQSDWTFEYALPPNPLVVDATAPPTWTVRDTSSPECQECEAWDGSCTIGSDPPDVWSGQVVHQHGTYRFPYQTLGAAVNDAERAILETGLSWTVLVRPGQYHEAITIAVPLTLEMESGLQGTAQIG
jgi:hypothetical protein